MVFLSYKKAQISTGVLVEPRTPSVKKNKPKTKKGKKVKAK